MRRVVYQALLRAPLRIAGSVSGVAGFVGSVWPEKVKAVIGEGVPVQPVGIVLLGAAAIYFLLLWLLKPGESKSGGAGRSQTTHGPSSPAVGVVQGDFHMYPPPPATQERKKPATECAADEIARQVRIANSGLPRGLATFKLDPKPNLNLNELLVRIYKLLGPPPAGNLEQAKFWERVDLEIADKVSHNNLHVWGRTGKRPLTLIELDKWEVSEFDHRLKTLHVPVAYSSGYDLSDLHFYRPEIDRIWPKLLEATSETIPQPSRRAESAAAKLADPYREAVLQLEKAQVTKLAGAGGPGITAVECTLFLEGKAALQECQVWLDQVRSGDTADTLDALIRIGRREKDGTCKTTFPIHRASAAARVMFLKRDLTDVVSNPPFLIFTDQGNYPLEDNTTYYVDMELRSEAKYPTKVTLRIVTGTKDELAVSIESQRV